MSGQLFYLMGASGSGKDTLLANSRMRLLREARCLIAPRYITRSPDPEGEWHIPVSPEEFRERLAHQLFAMHWDAHGLSYGLGTEIDAWLEKGFHVLVNGSRAYLRCAKARYPGRFQPVHLQVNPDVLKERLRRRGRENEAAIADRIARAIEAERHVAANTPVIRNDGPIGDAVEALLACIQARQKVGALA